MPAFYSAVPGSAAGQASVVAEALALGWLAMAAMLMRSQAGLLLVAEGVYFAADVLQKVVKEKRLDAKKALTHPSLLIVVTGAALFLIVDKVIFPVPLSTSSFYGQFIGKAAQRPIMETIKANLELLTVQLTAFFHYDTYGPVSKVTMMVTEAAALPFIIIGFILSVNRRLAMEHVFFVLMCLLVLFLPVHDQRYFLPAMPLLYYYCYATLQIIVPAVTRMDMRLVAVGLSLLYLKAGGHYLQKTATEVPGGCIPQQSELDAFRYISTHVKDDEIIVFTLPRVLTLYTNKRTIVTAWQLPAVRNKEIMDSIQVKYMLVREGLDDQYFKTYLRETQPPVDSVKIAEGYTLYSLR